MKYEQTPRKRLRIENYDYSENGAYFITICTERRRQLFWSVGAGIARPDEEPVLSEAGVILRSAIERIPQIYQDVSVPNFVVMPNHIHMILQINRASGRAMPAPTVSTVIGQMKGYVTKQIGMPIWQKSFFDHIIRNEEDYRQIWQYIDTNPAKWTEDELYITT